MRVDNHTYNLTKALTKKAQSVWRYDQYLKDSADCEECQRLWKKLKGEDGAHLAEMKRLLSSHFETDKTEE